jgi:hypothetical protein
VDREIGEVNFLRNCASNSFVVAEYVCWRVSLNAMLSTPLGYPRYQPPHR